MSPCLLLWAERPPFNALPQVYEHACDCILLGRPGPADSGHSQNSNIAPVSASCLSSLEAAAAPGSLVAAPASLARGVGPSDWMEAASLATRAWCDTGGAAAEAAGEAAPEAEPGPLAAAAAAAAASRCPNSTCLLVLGSTIFSTLRSRLW